MKLKSYVLFILLALLVCMTGCNLGGTADRATYDAIAPEYLGYVEADPALTEEQKNRRRETVRSWEAKLPKGEDGVKTENQSFNPCLDGSGPCGCGAGGCQRPCDGCCGPGLCVSPAGAR